MVKNKNKKPKKQQYLFIKVHKQVLEVINEYCKDTGIDKEEIGFHTGFIAGKGPEIMFPLSSLTQLYFFAGIYYAKKYKDKFEYTFNTKKPESMIDKLKEKFKQANKEETNKPDYMG